MMILRIRVIAGLVSALLASAAAADEAISVGGALALLNKPKTPRAVAILIPGGDGVMDVQADGTFARLQGNQLVRTRKAYPAHGIATLTLDRGVAVAQAVRAMRSVARKVVVVGTSRGTLRVPAALAGRPDGIVLTAGFLDDVRRAVGSAARLPPTLVVHHRNDRCRVTLPVTVAPFKAWGGARVTVAWMDGGNSGRNPCRGFSHHGFHGIDGEVVATVARFINALR